MRSDFTWISVSDTKAKVTTAVRPIRSRSIRIPVPRPYARNNMASASTCSSVHPGCLLPIFNSYHQGQYRCDRTRGWRRLAFQRTLLVIPSVKRVKSRLPSACSHSGKRVKASFVAVASALLLSKQRGRCFMGPVRPLVSGGLVITICWTILT